MTDRLINRITRKSKTVLSLLYNRILFFFWSTYLKIKWSFGRAELQCDPKSDLIVSVTSFGYRVEYVYLTILTMMNQSRKPKKIILWLAEEEFTSANLPRSLQELASRGLTIEFCPDYRSYKKYIPGFSIYAANRIITIDDDILYPRDFIERLVLTSDENPETVVCYRGNRIRRLESGRPSMYRTWAFDVDYRNCQKEDFFFTTGSGTLFPPNPFPLTDLQYDRIKDVCPYADDIWINVLCRRNDIEVVQVPQTTPYLSRFAINYHAQNHSLSRMNIGQDLNDKQLKATLQHFGTEI